MYSSYFNNQKELARKVILTDQFNDVNFIAGADVAYDKNSDQLVAAIVILNIRTLKVIDQSICTDVARFPYISGLFSFRELPPLKIAYENLKTKPDIIVVDGQGFAHPRRFGLACHLGVELDIPTIGCAKSKLIGEYKEVDSERGSVSEIIDNNEVIGKVVRTQSNIKPVFISIGHKISLETAVNMVLRISPNYRLPETTRQADQRVKLALKNIKTQG